MILALTHKDVWLLGLPSGRDYRECFPVSLTR